MFIWIAINGTYVIQFGYQSEPATRPGASWLILPMHAVQSISNAKAEMWRCLKGLTLCPMNRHWTGERAKLPTEEAEETKQTNSQSCKHTIWNLCPVWPAGVWPQTAGLNCCGRHFPDHLRNETWRPSDTWPHVHNAGKMQGLAHYRRTLNNISDKNLFMLRNIWFTKMENR